MCVDVICIYIYIYWYMIPCVVCRICMCRLMDGLFPGWTPKTVELGNFRWWCEVLRSSWAHAVNFRDTNKTAMEYCCFQTTTYWFTVSYTDVYAFKVEFDNTWMFQALLNMQCHELLHRSCQPQECDWKTELNQHIKNLAPNSQMSFDPISKI